MTYGRMQYAAYLAEQYGPATAVRYHTVCAEMDRKAEAETNAKDSKKNQEEPTNPPAFRGKQSRTSSHPDCPYCNGTWTVKRGKRKPRRGGEAIQKYHCNTCYKTFIAPEDVIHANRTHYPSLLGQAAQN